MRIIAGEFRGRPVKFPNSKLTRPTTDKVKESLFNYLVNYIDFEDIKVCDIYAGSGSLGLESLSRGAATADFIEKNFPVFKTLENNISSLGCTKRSRIFKMPALKFSKMQQHEQYDLILADPPFFYYDVHDVVKNLMERDYLKDEGVLIVERSVQTRDKDVEAFEQEPFKKLGDSLIYQFEK